MKFTYEEVMERWQTVYDIFYEHDLEITDEMQEAMQEDLRKAKA